MRRLYHKLMAVAVAALFAPPAGAQCVEYFWDDDPGVGNGQVLRQFSGNSASIQTELDASTLSTGIHYLGLRALNDSHFSATYYRQFFVPEDEEQITRIEYSWDRDVVPGTGIDIPFTPGSAVDLTQNLPTDGLTTGIHTLYLRVLSTNHHSLTYTRSFFITPAAHEVNAIEYFFDTDPGVGNGNRIAASISNGQLAKSFDVDTDGLSDGVHKIGLRTLTDGTWSATYYRQFLIRTVTDNYITRLEYFWDTDPGAGNGYVVDITPGEEVTIGFEADMFGLSEGNHSLGLRAQSATGGWSTTSITKNIEFEGWDALQEYLNSLVDTEDSYASGVYQRQYLNNDWQALYVPFTMDFSDWADHFDVARINAFYQYDDDENGVVDRQVLEAIIVRPGNGRLKANYPYLIRPKTTGTFTFNIPTSKQASQKVNSVSCSTLEAKYAFTGNYTDLTGLKSAQRYRLRGGSLSIPESDSEVLPPFRWYLTVDDLGNQLDPVAGSRIAVNVIGEDETTDVEALENLVTDQQREVYDMQGRKVGNGTLLKSGIYIINGKKHVIK